MSEAASYSEDETSGALSVAVVANGDIVLMIPALGVQIAMTLDDSIAFMQGLVECLGVAIKIKLSPAGYVGEGGMA